jgi:hypothetical protein
VLETRFGHGAAHSAKDRILLDGDNSTGLLRGGEQASGIQWLQRVQTQDPAGQPFVTQLVRRVNELGDDSTGSDQRDIGPLTQRARTAKGERTGGVIVEVAGALQSQVGWTIVPHDCIDCLARFPAAARRANDDPGERA